MNERETLKINRQGHLEIGGADCVDLAKEFGTPLYVFDERYIRKMMQTYRNAFKNYEGGSCVRLQSIFLYGNLRDSR